MPTTVRGRYFYWYMMKDIYSRKLVMNEVWEQESSEHASVLLAKGCLREGLAGRPLVLHSDNGSAMKGATMRAAMIDLGQLAVSARQSTVRCGPSSRSTHWRRLGNGCSASCSGTTKSTATAA